MHSMSESHCRPISQAVQRQASKISPALSVKHGSRRVLRSLRQRNVVSASNSNSKSSKETDTAPEGKGEQREQPANRTDGRMTWTKLRVERQTHLPASREEAWQALQSLLPSKEWKETSAVFASLEAIYR